MVERRPTDPEDPRLFRLEKMLRRPSEKGDINMGVETFLSFKTRSTPLRRSSVGPSKEHLLQKLEEQDKVLLAPSSLESEDLGAEWPRVELPKAEPDKLRPRLMVPAPAFARRFWPSPSSALQ